MSVLWVKLISLGAGGSGVGSLHGANPAIVTVGFQRAEEYPRSPKCLPCPGNPCFPSNSALLSKCCSHTSSRKRRGMGRNAIPFLRSKFKPTYLVV